MMTAPAARRIGRLAAAIAASLVVFAVSAARTEAPPEPSGPAPAADLAADARRAALVEAATAYGMEAGMTWRAGRITAALEARAAELDTVWDFRGMMIHSAGAVVAPPVLRRIDGAMRIAGEPPHRDASGPAPDPDIPGAAAAAQLRQAWRIVNPARILVRTPHWRDFLVRQWPDPEPLPAILNPVTQAERDAVEAARRDGWDDGVALADAIHDEDIDRLTQTWLGMAEWRRLVLAGMAVPPELRHDRNAVSGGGGVLRLDETSVAIAVPGRLNPVMADWRPLERRGPPADRGAAR